MATGGLVATSFASMLEAMSREAGLEVEGNVRRLRRVVGGGASRGARHGALPQQLPLYLYVAVRQLYRTYLTVTWEVSQLAELDGTAPGALERLSRTHLVHRIHRGGGDFALIGRVCLALAPHAESSAEVADAERVLRSWTDREAHLFRMLVPLANYLEALSQELAQLTHPEAIVARVKEAQRELAPARRQLATTSRLLHALAEELKPLAGSSPSVVSSPSTDHREGLMNKERHTPPKSDAAPAAHRPEVAPC
jgi:hypothetical protein